MCEPGDCGGGRGEDVRERSPLHELGNRDQLGFFEDAEFRGGGDKNNFRVRVRRNGASSVSKGPLVRFVYFVSDKANCVCECESPSYICMLTSPFMRKPTVLRAHRGILSAAPDNNLSSIHPKVNAAGEGVKKSMDLILLSFSKRCLLIHSSTHSYPSLTKVKIG